MAKAATLVGDKLARPTPPHADTYKDQREGPLRGTDHAGRYPRLKTSTQGQDLRAAYRFRLPRGSHRAGPVKSNLDPGVLPPHAWPRLPRSQGPGRDDDHRIFIDPKGAPDPGRRPRHHDGCHGSIESQTDRLRTTPATMNSNIDALTKALGCQ